MKIKIPKKKVRYILSVLEKRGYLTKDEGTDKYILSKKIAMLV
jgi:DNA-binding IclR family transcriptional regulator